MMKLPFDLGAFSKRVQKFQLSLFGEGNDRAREKNFLAILILLLGLFVGSLFVDIGELISGSGFSGKAVRTHTLLTSGGKTWVAYTEPAIPLKVLSASDCPECSPDEALVWLRRIVPTVNAQKVEATSTEGKKLIADLGLMALPSFVFDKAVSTTDFYTQAGPLFREKNGSFIFDMNKIGLPVGKYLQAPPVTDLDIQIGKKDAPIKFTVFSDFDCQYCKTYNTTVKQVLTTYGDQVYFVFKHLPLPSHPQANNAAEAASCAEDQGKFMVYTDLLFANQTTWDKTTGTAKLKSLALRVPGMNYILFSSCLDSKKFEANIQADVQTAQDFNVSAAPTSFIGTEVVTGAAPFADLKKIIDDQSAK